MIALILREIPAARTGGGEPRRAAESVVSDSRLAHPGSLFVALTGGHHDGHDFVAHACRRGAVAALCQPGRARPSPGLAILEAEDQLAMLGLIAHAVRRRSRARVVGIAGAAGKTSTKDILRALCAPHAPTVASHGSYNNELGVPLTLCRLEPETRIAICELGTGAPGELAGLCGIAEPEIGIVTSLGPEHLASFGSVEAATREEAELIAALPRGGTAVIPWGQRRLERHRPEGVNVIRFGLDRRADVSVESWRPSAEGCEVVVWAWGARVRMNTTLRAPHHHRNLAAAAAAYLALGLPLAGIGNGAEAVELSGWRDEESRLRGGGVLINDAYNANPVSMVAAIEALAARRAHPRKVAVLGEMAELGRQASAWHRLIGARAGIAGIDLLVAVGRGARAYRDGAGARIELRCVPDVEGAARLLRRLLRPGDAVLLKGSRAAGLERIAEELR